MLDTAPEIVYQLWYDMAAYSEPAGGKAKSGYRKPGETDGDARRRLMAERERFKAVAGEGGRTIRA